MRKSLFNFAMKNLKQYYWNEVWFNNSPVEVSFVQCDGDDPKGKRFFEISLSDIHTFSDIQKEYHEMFCHVDKHHNEATFHSCNERSSCHNFRS